MYNLVGDSGDGEAYHGYWAQNIYALNSNFGAESDLVALSAALHAKGMYLMVDVAPNDMGYLGCGTCVDYSVFTPFNSVWEYHYVLRRDRQRLTQNRNLITTRSVSLTTAMLQASRFAGKETILFPFQISVLKILMY